ncbi:MAG: hypothetical protein ACRCVL_01190, partial [Cetobacterium sp.]
PPAARQALICGSHGSKYYDDMIMWLKFIFHLNNIKNNQGSIEKRMCSITNNNIYLYIYYLTRH